eukprot:CAMPEP_0202728990 /NCGR_PEP_ID=MMETSP1385-20130828/185904_1 /ASSEMBLY_ACC=CAM_ASM_000861 /TAXON_ID=933848 /ORGANISM="Elphidium margaritaceum" /LENGTH=778 /DNA_ID=CAMNT_0049395243 /DNA_START=195 /DNA_END=2532 /DNA_ORIENTATION=+
MDDLQTRYQQILADLKQSDTSSLVLWSGLQQLYCAKTLQHIEHFPSDLIWNHKTKNVYLLELERAIKEPKWREWLHICYGVVVPICDANEFSKPWIKKKGSNVPPQPHTMIHSDSIKTLVPFLIQQTLKDTYLRDEILQKLTAEHSEKILKQFMDRIERSDLCYLVHQRNQFIAKHGNQPLLSFLKYDAQFADAVHSKLEALQAIDASLAAKFKQCWSQGDETFKRFAMATTEKTFAMGEGEGTVMDGTSARHEHALGYDSYSAEELRALLAPFAMNEGEDAVMDGTSARHEHALGYDSYSAEELRALLDTCNEEHDSARNEQAHHPHDEIALWHHDQEMLLSTSDFATESLEGEPTATSGQDRLIYDALRYFIDKVPPQYRAHHNLLRHTLDDCAKLAMLDADVLPEGYTGDNAHFKWGLWRANHLPIFTVRPHLLYLRDILCNPRMLGSYIEIDGKYGSGKSLALMYAVNIARQQQAQQEQQEQEQEQDAWLCVYCPNTHEWVQNIKATVPANDRDSVFYQHEYARSFLRDLQLAEADKLQHIPLQNEYKVLRTHGEDENARIDLQTVYAMLEDPIDIKRYESQVIEEWLTMGAPYFNEHGEFVVSDASNAFETVYDLVRYGLSADCKSPASLMYDLMDELTKQRHYKLLIACDNVNWWSDFMYGLSTPRTPKVFAWQLSMIDIFSQFQQRGALANGIVVMSKTTMGKHRTEQFKSTPSHTIVCPEHYNNDEFDCAMWNYQGVKLCSPNIAPDDYNKVYAASARNPIYAQRLAALY